MTSEIQNNFQSIWGKVLNDIQENNIFDEPVFHSYIKKSLLYNVSDDLAVIEVPYITDKNFFIQNIDEFNRILSNIYERDIKSQVVLTSEISNIKNDSNDDFIFEYGNKILEQYTFDNFIQGQSNQQSFAAAYGCAYSKEKSFFNPLFIYGNSGLGKTHLLHAICNYLKENRPDVKYLYIDGNDFISLIINSLKEKNTDRLLI